LRDLKASLANGSRSWYFAVIGNPPLILFTEVHGSGDYKEALPLSTTSGLSA
jgi:hypothetical protein